MTKGFMGVDFGSRYIHSIGVDKHMREFSITDYLLLGMPDGAYEQMFRANGADQDSGQSEVLNDLYEVIESEWLSGQTGLHASLPGDLLSLRTLELPFLQPKKIAQLVGFEAEGHLPFTIDEIVLDYFPLNTYEGNTELLVAAVGREKFSQILDKMLRLGLDPGAIVGQGLCLHHLCALKPAWAGTCHAYLDIGASKAMFTVVDSERPQLVRTIPLGGDHLTRAIMKEFDLSFEEAEAGKINEGLVLTDLEAEADPSKQRIARVLTESLYPLTKLCRQTVMYMSRHRSSDQTQPLNVERIILTGGSANLRGLPELLQERLKIPVEVFRIPDELIQTDDLPLSAHPQMAEALALALQGAAPQNRPSLNFRKGEFAYKRESRMLRRRLIFPAVLLVCLFISFGLWSMSRGRSGKNEIERIQAGMAADFQAKFPGTPALNPLEQTRQKLQEAKTKSEKYGDLNTASALEVWAAISDKVPDNIIVKLEKFSYSQDKLRLEGKANDYKDAKAVADYLSPIPFFSKVELEDTRSLRGGEIHFAIQIRLAGAEGSR